MKRLFAVKSSALLTCLAFSLMFNIGSQPIAMSDELAPGREMAKQATKGRDLWITADHSKFKILQQEFKSGPEVTEACLSCHTEAALQFHKTIHWTWLDPNTRESTNLGKGGLSINNF